MRAPGVGPSSHAIDPLMLERLVEAVKDRPEEDLGELLEVANSLFFLIFVLKFGVKVYKLVGIVPVLIEHPNIHHIFRTRIIGDIFPSEISRR